MALNKIQSRYGLVLKMRTNIKQYLKVSRIIVKSTNFPSSGTTSEVGGMISASSKKNTVSDRRIEMDKLT